METHSLIKDYFVQLATTFEEFFGKPKNKKLPFQKDSHEWLNYFYKSPVFRHIHLEYYKTDKICVLHSNIFPNPLIDLPILGFDMIALGNKITGIFFDFTPTVTYYESLSFGLRQLQSKYKEQKRELPEWADFFSNNFLCITPEQDEKILESLTDITYYIKLYLTICSTQIENYKNNISMQNKYCKGQKKNDKTFKALAVEIGEANAKKFLTDYLFPEIDISFGKK